MASRKPKTRKPAGSPAPGEEVLRAYPFIKDFLSYSWGGISAAEGYGIYSLCLFGNYPDFLDIATEALTEGADDKDVDFCLVRREEGSIFIGQSYLAADWDKLEAPANKADDLLTGLSWLLKPELDQIPSSIREKAREVQDALESEQISHVHLLFTHNCRQSDNVENALNTVASSAKILLQKPEIDVQAAELGLPKLQRLFESMTKPIVVEKEISFVIGDHFEEQGDDWRAVSTTLSGEDLHRLYEAHGNDLFSANVRGYLNMLNRKSINKGIMETITQEPTRFWTYNNGITILTRKIELPPNRLVAHGVSIINGAQTTGVIGNAPVDSAKRVRVPCRFVECNKQDVIDSIVQKNNTQNEIKSFDLRSNDPTQKRLREEFHKYGITYIHRREGAVRATKETIQAEVLAPYLAAFHGHFHIATRQRRAIFEEQSIYGDVFPPGICAEHIYLVQSLAEAVGEIKLAVKSKVDHDEANDVDLAMHEILQHSTTKFFIVGVVGELADMIMNRPVPSRLAWIMDPSWVRPDRTKAKTTWSLTLEALIPLVAEKVGNGATSYENVRSAAKLKEVARNVKYTIQALKKQLESALSPIRDVTDIRILSQGKK